MQNFVWTLKGVYVFLLSTEDFVLVYGALDDPLVFVYIFLIQPLNKINLEKIYLNHP